MVLKLTSLLLSTKLEISLSEMSSFLKSIVLAPSFLINFCSVRTNLVSSYLLIMSQSGLMLTDLKEYERRSNIPFLRTKSLDSSCSTSFASCSL